MINPENPKEADEKVSRGDEGLSKISEADLYEAMDKKGEQDLEEVERLAKELAQLKLQADLLEKKARESKNKKNGQ